MCGRLSQVFEESFLNQFLPFPTYFSKPHVQRYNCAPGQLIYCGIYASKIMRFGPLYWGVQPSWSKRRIINATWEKASQGSGYWSQWKRCIIPSTGFYEWKGKGGSKQAFHIQTVSNQMIFFAALWSWMTDKTAAVVILTTKSEDWMLNVHHRQPLILSSDNLIRWLEGNTPDLACPLPMKLNEIGPYVNHVANEGPQCWMGK